MRFWPHLLGLLCLVGCSTEVERAPDVVLISLDTIVPGRLGCYGGAVPTPNIDALARDGVLFTEARSVAPITLPAHASMLTGLTPTRHGVRVNGAMGLSEEAVTVAEDLRVAGYQTAGFVGAQVLDAKYGLSQGFDVYEDASGLQDGSMHLGELPGSTIVDRALAWFGARDTQRPSFMWVHLFDPHVPYSAPAEFVARTNGDPYAAEIAFADHQIGRLLSALDERTVIVFVGDHGESFGAHGEATHGAFIFDVTLRVPLIVRSLDRTRAGDRDAANVSVVDVAPTLLRAAGLDSHSDADGVDLAGELAPGRGVYCESYYGFNSFGWSPMSGWIQDGWKLVQAPDSQLFHLAIDADEANDLSATALEQLARLRENLRAAIDLPSLRPVAVYEGAEQEALLAQLGYAGGGIDAKTPEYPSALELSELPSPHSRASQLGAFSAAQQLLARGQPDIAMSRLREILTDNSRNHSAQQLVGLCLIQLKQWQPALGAFRSSMRYRQGEWAGGWLNMGVCLDNMGNTEVALNAYLRSHAIAPLPEQFRPRVRALLQSQGRADELAQIFGDDS